MLHNQTTFGRKPTSYSRRLSVYELRAIIARRREARRAALLCAALTVACAAGAGMADASGNDGGAILLAICAFMALLCGTAAAGEA